MKLLGTKLDFYQLLFKTYTQNVNPNLNWYENLFASFIGGVKKLIAKFLKIKGNTLVWNQLVIPNASSSVTSGATITMTDGVLAISGTPTSAIIQKRLTFLNSSIPQGHKVLLSGNSAHFSFRLQGDSAYKTTVNGAFILSVSAGALTDIVLYGGNLDTTVTYNESFYPQTFDLTQMFGSGNEPSTVDEFTSLYPLPYYSYDSGSLLSFNGTGIKSVGFNQWDEVWELGRLVYDSTDPNWGQNYNTTSQIRSKNYVPVLPNTEYYGYLGSTYNMYAIFYGADKNPVMIGNLGFLNITNRTFITPSNCHYIRFYVSNTVSYDNNICINISDPSKNGTYEPYTSSTTSLPISTYFPTGMKSAGSVYDELTPSKAIQRVGSRSYQAGDESDSSVTTDGTATYYALETPIETDISPALDLSYEIEWGGTEELLPENTSTPTTSPILADINYPDGERDDQYFTYREITQTNVLLGKSLNTIMGREVEFNNDALDILMKGE